MPARGDRVRGGRHQAALRRSLLRRHRQRARCRVHGGEQLSIHYSRYCSRYSPCIHACRTPIPAPASPPLAASRARGGEATARARDDDLSPPSSRQRTRAPEGVLSALTPPLLPARPGARARRARCPRLRRQRHRADQASFPLTMRFRPLLPLSVLGPPILALSPLSSRRCWPLTVPPDGVAGGARVRRLESAGQGGCLCDARGAPRLPHLP